MRVQAVQWIKPVQHKVKASVAIPGSKSITNRALLLAALAHGQSHLAGVLASDDTIVFLQALQALGFTVEYDQARGACYLIGNGGRIPKETAKIWCGSAGTASRFLLAAVATGQGTFEFDASTQMRSRPIGPLVQALQVQGADIRLSPGGSFPLTLRAGGLAGGRVQVSSGDESSQYLSAMLMAAPLAKQPVELGTSVSVSKPFIDMTVRMMEEFGVTVKQDGYERFRISAPSPYHGRTYAIEADASTASYFFGAAAITGGTVHARRISRRDSLQGDARFPDILEAMGCTVTERDDGVSVTGPRRLRGITADLGDISDTAMTLACVAPYADSPTTIQNIGHIRLQESDRIAALATNLQQMGIRTEAGPDSLTVYPGTPHGAVIDPFGDHRIAMAFSMMGLATPGVGVSDPECVAKTCPEFYDLLEGLYER